MLEAVLKQRMLMIEADGCLHFVPFENIKYMSVFPAPDAPVRVTVKVMAYAEPLVHSTCEAVAALK